MKGPRLLLVVLYTCYLVQAGLLMAMLPWSAAWSILLLRLNPSVAAWLDVPSIKGLVTAFGLLHLLLLALELKPPRPQNGSAPRDSQQADVSE